MTFAELQTEVTRRLNESSTAAAYWTVQDVKDALNEGYAELSDASEWYERSATISKASQRTYYDLRTNLSDTFLAPRRAFNVETNKWLDPINVRKLDFHTFRQWEINPGEPQMMFMRGLWWLGLYPRPNASTGTVTFYYTAMPPDLSADGDTPTFPQEYHLGIVLYALYELKSQERESKLAMKYFGEYEIYEKGLTKYVLQRQGLDRSRAMGV